jgi:hypothetical protein
MSDLRGGCRRSRQEGSGIAAQADTDAARELDAAMEKADLFERAFGARAILRRISETART